jgi:hypothetical protein
MSETDITDFKARFQRLLELRETRDIDKQKASRSEQEYRAAEAELFEAIQDAGIRGRISFDFGGDLGRASFQLRSTNYGRVVDKDAALNALKTAGLDDVIYHTAIREGRLNELVRDRLESRDELPDGVDFYTRKGISISRKG